MGKAARFCGFFHARTSFDLRLLEQQSVVLHDYSRSYPVTFPTQLASHGQTKNQIMKLERFSKFILLIGLFTAATSALAGVNKGSITGKVIDKLSNQPIPFVSVTLGLLPDTTIKKSVQTDDKGNYKFDQVPDGRYVVSAYMVGYGRKHSKPLACKQNSVKVETLTMENTVIQEVTVNGKRPEIEQKADRTVLNVENSTTAAAENALEVLRKAPGVNIDKDDKISLKGKEGVMVTINDKPTYLSGQELASYLKTLNGTEIEKVELITTPPSRYEAEGNTGIINIKIKKNNKIGVNGSANAGITITHKVSGNAGVSLNMRKGKLNTFGSVYGRNGHTKNSIYIERRMKGDTSLIVQDSKSYYSYQNYSFRVGADYEPNHRHTFGVLARGSFFTDASSLSTRTNLMLKDGSLGKYLKSTTDKDEDNPNITLNANYKMAIDTNGRTLNMDIDYVTYSSRGNEHNNTYYFDPSNSPLGNPLFLRNQTPSDIYIKSFRADYVHPFSKTTTMEAGVKGSIVDSDNNLKYERFFQSDNLWRNDTERSNHFKFREGIVAAYTSIACEKNGWSIKGGLRAEQTVSKGNQVTISTITKRSYLDLFPSFFIQRTINKKNSVGISYNRRLNRPSYSKLNPFIWRIDEYTYQEGNPLLRPQYSNNIEVNHAWNSCIFTSLGYSHTNNVQMQVTEEVEIVKPTNGSELAEAIKAVKIVERNIKKLNSYTLNVSANFSPVSWFRTNNNITAMYNEYSRGNNQTGNSKAMCQLYSSNSFILPQQYIFEVMARYQSPMAYGMIDIDSQYSINIGVQKRFLKNKLSARISLDDVFNTINNKAWAKYDNMDLYNYNKWSSRRLNLSLTYRFGSKDVKQARQRSTSSEEEQGRTGK